MNKREILDRLYDVSEMLMLNERRMLTCDDKKRESLREICKEFEAEIEQLNAEYYRL